VIREHSFLMN